MSAVLPAVGPLPPVSRAWILSPAQDTLFVVAAPVLVLAAALVSFSVLGAADATAYILLLHVADGRAPLADVHPRVRRRRSLRRFRGRCSRPRVPLASRRPRSST
jgi:hypothetical protein